MIERLTEFARRVMLRTGAGRLRRVWQVAYRAVAQGVSAYLRAGHPAVSVYSMGPVGGPDAVYGVSDVDLAVVIPTGEGSAGDARDDVSNRWERMCRRVPWLRRLVFVAVYDDHQLDRAASRSPFLRSGRSTRRSTACGEALLGPDPFLDPANVASRPILLPLARSWHRLAGPDRLPSNSEPVAQDRGLGAWLELQHWWRYAFGACAAPGPRAAYLCVKLASEPARIWLWLVHGERVSSRRDALRRGVEVLPEESEAFERALALHRALPTSPEAPLAEALAAFVRLTGRIASRLGEEAEAEGVEEVRLRWDDADELVLPRSSRDPLGALHGFPSRLLPLVDWRALVWPGAPDEALAALPGHPAAPSTLGRVAVAGRAGPYPVLRHGALLILPTQVHQRALLRAVQCPLTDPISFAVLDGARSARFSRAPGWSIHETAGRAVAEHRAWLRAGGGAGEAGVEGLGVLFTAARAGLLADSLESGEPELALTLAAVARELDGCGPRSRSAAQSSYEAYVASRSRGGTPPTRALADLRKRVLALPAFRDAAGVGRRQGS